MAEQSELMRILQRIREERAGTRPAEKNLAPQPPSAMVDPYQRMLQDLEGQRTDMYQSLPAERQAAQTPFLSEAQARQVLADITARQREQRYPGLRIPASELPPPAWQTLGQIPQQVAPPGALQPSQPTPPVPINQPAPPVPGPLVAAPLRAPDPTQAVAPSGMHPAALASVGAATRPPPPQAGAQFQPAPPAVRQALIEMAQRPGPLQPSAVGGRPAGDPFAQGTGAVPSPMAALVPQLQQVLPPGPAANPITPNLTALQNAPRVAQPVVPPQQLAIPPSTFQPPRYSPDERDPGMIDPNMPIATNQQQQQTQADLLNRAERDRLLQSPGPTAPRAAPKPPPVAIPEGAGPSLPTPAPAMGDKLTPDVKARIMDELKRLTRGQLGAAVQ